MRTASHHVHDTILNRHSAYRTAYTGHPASPSPAPCAATGHPPPPPPTPCDPNKTTPGKRSPESRHRLSTVYIWQNPPLPAPSPTPRRAGWGPVARVCVHARAKTGIGGSATPPSINQLIGHRLTIFLGRVGGEILVGFGDGVALAAPLCGTTACPLCPLPASSSRVATPCVARIRLARNSPTLEDIRSELGPRPRVAQWQCAVPGTGSGPPRI